MQSAVWPFTAQQEQRQGKERSQLISYTLRLQGSDNGYERSHSIVLVPVGNVGSGRAAVCSHQLSPFGLFLNVPWDSPSCISCPLGASGSHSGRVALLLFSAKWSPETSSTPVTSKCVISLPELHALLVDETSFSALQRLSHCPVVSWCSRVSWWTGLSPLPSTFSWPSPAVGNKIHRPSLCLF